MSDFRLMAMVDPRGFAALRREYQAHRRTLPKQLTRIPQSEIDAIKDVDKPFEVWRSQKYLVQMFRVEGSPLRLSINRADLLPNGNWADGITWDDIQRIKGEVGFADQCAVEIFPPDAHVVNVANIRHIWIVSTPSFAWRKGGA